MNQDAIDLPVGKRPPGPVVTLQLAAPLRIFLAARHRGRDVPVACDGTSSLGHVVESLGVPLPEVGGMRTPAGPVAESYRPRSGDVIVVSAVGRPQRCPTDPPRFLLDVHLGTLARRLRLLGIDTAYRNDADDNALVAQAGVEQRVLLTQDRGMLRRRALRHGAYVRGSRPAEQLRDVLDRFAPPLRPFRRCTACNGLLSPVPKGDVADVLKPGTRRSYAEFSRCMTCGRVYWRGAHSARLDALVAEAAGEPGP